MAVALALLWCLRGQAGATGQTNGHAQNASPRPDRSATAHPLAAARYRLWHRVQTRYGFPFETFDVHRTVLLFPSSRADRLYVLVDEPYWPSGPPNGTQELFCFQTDGRRDRLVYKVPFRDDYHSGDSHTTPRSLRDFLRGEGWLLGQGPSRVAEADLIREGVYAAYEYILQAGTLSVGLAIDVHGAAGETGAWYALYQDPFTGVHLNPGTFYRRYGLPVAAGEWPGARSGVPQNTSGPIRRPAPAAPSRDPQARRLARGRYDLVRQLRPGFGVWSPIEWVTDESVDTVVFPVGQADRAYRLLWHEDVKNTNRDTNALLCYERKGGKPKLVYRINFAWKAVAGRTPARLRSLLDYIHACRDQDGKCAVPGRMSKSAEKDIAARRDYVQYTEEPYLGDEGLGVSLLSDLEPDNVPAGEALRSAWYDLDKDPFTGAKLKKGEFNARYGLPADSRELPLR